MLGPLQTRSLEGMSAAKSVIGVRLEKVENGVGRPFPYVVHMGQLRK